MNAGAKGLTSRPIATAHPARCRERPRKIRPNAVQDSGAPQSREESISTLSKIRGSLTSFAVKNYATSNRIPKRNTPLPNSQVNCGGAFGVV